MLDLEGPLGAGRQHPFMNCVFLGPEGPGPLEEGPSQLSVRRPRYKREQIEDVMNRGRLAQALLPSSSLTFKVKISEDEGQKRAWEAFGPMSVQTFPSPWP